MRGVNLLSLGDAVQCAHMKKQLIITIISLALAVLACNAPGRGTPDEAAVEEPEELVRIPTLRAQQTELAEAAELFDDEEALATLQTPRPQEPQSTLTPQSGEPAPITGGTGATALPPEDAQVVEPNNTGDGEAPVPQGGAALTDVGGYDGGDGYTTTVSLSIVPGQSITQSIASTVEAHNYTFEAAVNQSVVIVIDPNDFTDPRVKLIGPTGGIVRTGEGGNQGGTVTMELTLEEAGTYTIRIDIWPPAPGEYTISLQ